MTTEKLNLLWWQEGIIYQVYPRSFQDSNDDGIGDLPGIIKRLDYLQWLGVTAIWISPIYPSPMIDFGYDISDYEDLHPNFGSLRDFDVLVEEVHARKMKLILDLVPNHTSTLHPWFQESRSARDNPKRNWYIWHDGTANEVPNNWLSEFGGSAWQWDEDTQQYYYHAFDKSQPDLNWRNEEVQQAMFNIMRYWLRKGVDGFRVDVMWHLIKDEMYRDNPPNPDYQTSMAEYHKLLPVHSTDQIEVHDIVRKMREVLDEFDDRMMIGEVYLPIQKLVTYYGLDLKGAHLPFNFQLISLPWTASAIAPALIEYEAALPLGGWPNWVLSNHDKPRICSRAGSDQASVAAVLLLTLRGTPTLYYGDEIGMRDVSIPVDEIRDPRGLNSANKNLTRDPARTPMQWDTSTNAGFSKHVPWLRIDKHYQSLNVASQRQNKSSMLMLYKRLINLRKSEPAFTMGDFVAVFSDNRIIAYLRQFRNTRFLVILNLSHRPCYYMSKEDIQGTVELSTAIDDEGKAVDRVIPIGGDEGMVIRLR